MPDSVTSGLRPVGGGPKKSAPSSKRARKYAPPPKAEKKKGGGFLSGVGGFFANIPDDAGKLAGGFKDLGAAAFNAYEEDRKRGIGIPGLLGYVSGGGPLTDRPIYWGGGIMGGQAATTRLGKSMVTGIPAQAKLLADPKAWYEDPGIQLFNLAGFALPAARVGSIGRLAQTIKRANPHLTKVEATKAAVVESFHPGFMAGQGVAGGIARRTIGGVAGRMPSRQPTVRQLIKAYDKASEKLDTTKYAGRKFSASQRAARMQQRHAASAVRRAEAENQVVRTTLRDAVVPSKWRRFWDRPGKTAPDIGAALTAMLEGPVSATGREAVQLRQGALRSILAQNEQITKMQDAVDTLIKARDDALAQGVDPPENIHAQIREGQAKIDNLIGKVAPVRGSASRSRIFAAMEESVGNKRANQLIKLWDKAARGLEPDDPHGWYDRVQARVMPAEKFVEAPDAPEPALFQRLQQEGWYFPLQRELEALPPEGRMQIGQLYKTLQKRGVSVDELRNSGLEAAYAADKNRVVTPAQFLGELRGGGYFETFRPQVKVVNDLDPSANQWESTHATQYDPEQAPHLNSRDSAPGEYHEMTIRVDQQGTRAGHDHWSEPGVIYHVRFQSYVDSNNRRVMLVDEIQSDWASDYRRAKKVGAHQRSPEETAAMRAAAEERRLAAAEALDEAKARQREVINELQQHIDDGVDPNTVPGLYDRLGDANHGITRASDAFDAAESDLYQLIRWQGSRVPMSPMGQTLYQQNAARQILRWADDNDVDRVVIVDGNTQALRNRAAEVENATIDEGFQDMGEWVDDVSGEPLTSVDITRDLGEQGTHGSFTKLYNEEYPKAFAKVAGTKGEHVDSAYVGRYSSYADPGDYQYRAYVQTGDGPMPGTVFEMTPEVKAKIRAEQPYYRLDPEGTPQGATEFLANGKRRVSMFETADVSTWVHELAHVALPDLDPADLAVLEREIAGGKKYADWGVEEKERFARSFETYLRDGHAEPALRQVFAKITKWMREIWRRTGHEAEQISPETADVFDRMLGRRYQNSVVLNKNQINQVRAEIADLQKALDSGDIDELEHARDALAHLADQAEQAGIEIMLRNAKSDEHGLAMLEGLARRKQAVVEDYRRRGLVGVGEEARGYFPHFSMYDSFGQPRVEPSRVSAVGDVVGTPRVPSRALAKQANKLIRYQTGEVLNDPTVITYILKARLRILETIKARNELWAQGKEIRADQPLPPGDWMYVRSPNEAPQRIRTATQAAQNLARGDFTRLQARRLHEDIDEMTTDAEGVMDEVFYDPKSKKPEPTWVHSEPRVRVVPRQVARTRLGDVFQSAPKGKATTTLGIANSLFRIASIYLPFWRYVPVNWAQNAVMLALTNPSAFTKLMTAQFRQLSKRDPQLGHMVREQVGTIQATALPDFNIGAQGRLQRSERFLNQTSGQFGELLGKAADVPIRANLWLRHAEKYGFKTDDELRRLITSDDPAIENIRDIVSQRTKEDLIDFDTLTPWEKETATRYLALWPFIRGITKWPLMYAREYPMRVAGLSYAGGAITQPPPEGSVQDQGMVDLLGRTVNIGKFDPSGPGREMAQALFATVRANGGVITEGKQPNLDPLVSEYAAPQVKEALGIISGQGKTNWLDSVMKTFLPGYSPIKKGTQGGSIATQVLRQMSMLREASESTKDSVNEWMAPADEMAQKFTERGLDPPPEVKAAQMLRAPYADWKMYESVHKFSRRDLGESDALSKKERVEGLLAVAKRHFPSLYAEAAGAARASGYDSAEEMMANQSSDFLEGVDRHLYDSMFGAMADMKRNAREAGVKVG